MTVSKVVLPADFGIENLDCPVHGNIVVNLQNNETMAANSMILGLHSPVFQDMFFSLGLTSVDMYDFHTANVRIFFGGLYCGKVEFTSENFREINKMAFVFKVDWLVAWSKAYFCEWVGSCVAFTTLDDKDKIIKEMNQLLEEAIYAQKYVQNPEFVEETVASFRKFSSDTVKPFIRNYMLDYSSLPTDQLDIMITIASNSVEVFLNILKERFGGVEQKGLDGNSKYLLDNIDLLKCMQLVPAAFEDLFEVLFEKMDKFDVLDAKFVAYVYRKTTRLFHSLAKQSSEEVEDSGENLLEAKNIPGQNNQGILKNQDTLHLFVDYHPLENLLYGLVMDVGRVHMKTTKVYHTLPKPANKIIANKISAVTFVIHAKEKVTLGIHYAIGGPHSKWSRLDCEEMLTYQSGSVYRCVIENVPEDTTICYRFFTVHVSHSYLQHVSIEWEYLDRTLFPIDHNNNISYRVLDVNHESKTVYIAVRLTICTYSKQYSTLLNFIVTQNNSLVDMCSELDNFINNTLLDPRVEAKKVLNDNFDHFMKTYIQKGDVKTRLLLLWILPELSRGIKNQECTDTLSDHQIKECSKFIIPLADDEIDSSLSYTIIEKVLQLVSIYREDSPFFIILLYLLYSKLKITSGTDNDGDFFLMMENKHFDAFHLDLTLGTEFFEENKQYIERTPGLLEFCQGFV